MKQEMTGNALIPQKAKGCSWESWGGAFGISDKLRIFDCDTRTVRHEVGDANDLSPRSRAALADHMISLWSRFKAGEVIR